MAAENSYGTTGVWASAKANWNHAVAIGSARLPYFANYLGWSYPVFW